MGPALDDNQKYDAAFWHGVLAKAKDIGGSKLVLAMARQKIDGWCAVYGGLTPAELHVLLEDMGSVMQQGREHQGIIHRPAKQVSSKPTRQARLHLRIIK